MPSTLQRCRRPATSRPAQGEDGFALIAVIWILAFLAVAAALFARGLNTHLFVARSAVGSAAAGAMAEAGIGIGILELLQDAVRTPRSVDPRRSFTQCRTADGSTIAVSVTDEAGKVDLNAAPEPLLIALLAGVGLPADDARAKAAAIIDYRDGDDIVSVLGAEKAQYAEAHRVGPKNAAFDLASELASVLGFDEGLAARLVPYVTVGSQSPGIDPRVAPAGLIGLLGKGAEGINGPRITLPDSTVQLPSSFIAPSAAQRFEIVAVAETATAIRAERAATVEIARTLRISQPQSRQVEPDPFASPVARDRNTPGRTERLDYRVLDWRTPVAAEFPRAPAGDATTLPPC